MRLSVEQAREMGVNLPDDVGQPSNRSGNPAAPKKKSQANQTGVGSPEWILRTLLAEEWPGQAIPGLKNVVPGRRFVLDVGFPHVKLAVECDGWEWHGKHKGDFQRDRERDRALLLVGWRTLRFFASEIRSTPDQVVRTVGEVVAMLEKDAR